MTRFPLSAIWRRQKGYIINKQTNKCRIPCCCRQQLCTNQNQNYIQTWPLTWNIEPETQKEIWSNSIATWEWTQESARLRLGENSPLVPFSGNGVYSDRSKQIYKREMQLYIRLIHFVCQSKDTIWEIKGGFFFFFFKGGFVIFTVFCYLAWIVFIIHMKCLYS